MCTNIVHQVGVSGSGKGAQGWFALASAAVAYDHPSHADAEHAVTIDFVDRAGAIGQRVAVELTVESARALAEAILAATRDAERV